MEPQRKTTPRVAIVGSGAIGTTIAHSLYLRQTGLEIFLVNRNREKAWAKAFDISHCGPELPGRRILPSSFEDCREADVIVTAAGVLPRADGKRTDVLRDNIAIFETIIPSLAENNPRAVLVNVTNPADSMAYAIERIGAFPPGRVLGSGTELDRLRLRHFLGERFGLEENKIDIEIVGEHGETMVPLWSRASYEGRLLRDMLPGLDAATEEEMLRKTKRAGWDIRQAGEHSTYAIAFSATRIVEAILGRYQEELCISSRLGGEYGLRDVYLSLPSRLTTLGVAQRRQSPLAAPEEEALRRSARAVEAQLREVDGLL